MRKKGFTLVELLVAVVVTAVLAAVVVGVMPSAIRRAKRSALAANISALQSGVDNFYLETNRFPCGTQPTTVPEGRLIDFSAPDGKGIPFVGGYVRFRPKDRAADLGLDPASGEKVYYGVTKTGRVFATQVPPDESGGWLDPNTLVWVREDTRAPKRLADICYAGGSVGSPAGMTLWSSSEEAQPGQVITVYGRVTDSSGNPVPGVRVRVDITGSVTGTRSEEVVTGQDGTFSLDVTTDVPEYLVVSATVV